MNATTPYKRSAKIGAQGTHGGLDAADAKARGRPRKPCGDESVNSRRERNRKAQQQFRLRQKVTDDEQKKHAETLEATLSHIVNIFLEFADQTLQSKWAQRDVPLIKALNRSIHCVISAVAEPGDHEPVQQPTEKEPEPDAGDEVDYQSITPPEEPRQHVENFVMEAGQMDVQRQTSVEAQQSAKLDWAAVLPLGYVNEMILDPSLRHNIFGNGWLGYDPPPSVSNPAKPTLDSPLSLQIAYMTMRRAYQALLDAAATADAETQIQIAFGLALRYFSREQILQRLGWLLGPGQHDLPRLATISPDLCCKFLRGRTELGAVGEEARARIAAMDGAYCNSNELARLIRERTQRQASQDSLEMVVAARPMMQGSGFPLLSPQPEMVSWLQESPFDMGQGLPMRTVRVSKASLLEQIARSGTCLGQGPLFRRADLDTFILVSEIPVS